MTTSELEAKLGTRIARKVAVIGVEARLYWRQSDGDTWIDYDEERRAGRIRLANGDGLAQGGHSNATGPGGPEDKPCAT